MQTVRRLCYLWNTVRKIGNLLLNVYSDKAYDFFWHLIVSN